MTTFVNAPAPRPLARAGRVRAAPRRRLRALPWLGLLAGSAVLAALVSVLALGSEPVHETALAVRTAASAAEVLPPAGPESTGAVPAGPSRPGPEPLEPASGDPLYALEVPDLTVLRQEVRFPGPGVREDLIALGDPAGQGAFLHLVARRSVRIEPTGRFYVALARLSAEAGLAVARSGRPRALASKFGAGEVAEAVLAGHSTSHPAERPCLLFRYQHPEIGFRLMGAHCPAGGTAAGEAEARLACLLDRLTLAAPREDAALRVLFIQADRRRGGACPSGNPGPAPRLVSREAPARPR